MWPFGKTQKGGNKLLGNDYVTSAPTLLGSLFSFRPRLSADLSTHTTSTDVRIDLGHAEGNAVSVTGSPFSVGKQDVRLVVQPQTLSVADIALLAQTVPADQLEAAIAARQQSIDAANAHTAEAIKGVVNQLQPGQEELRRRPGTLSPALQPTVRMQVESAVTLGRAVQAAAQPPGRPTITDKIAALAATAFQGVPYERALGEAFRSRDPEGYHRREEALRAAGYGQVGARVVRGELSSGQPANQSYLPQSPVVTGTVVPSSPPAPGDRVDQHATSSDAESRVEPAIQYVDEPVRYVEPPSVRMVPADAPVAPSGRPLLEDEPEKRLDDRAAEVPTGRTHATSGRPVMRDGQTRAEPATTSPPYTPLVDRDAPSDSGPAVPITFDRPTEAPAQPANRQERVEDVAAPAADSVAEPDRGARVRSAEKDGREASIPPTLDDIRAARLARRPPSFFDVRVKPATTDGATNESAVDGAPGGRGDTPDRSDARSTIDFGLRPGPARSERDTGR